MLMMIFSLRQRMSGFSAIYFDASFSCHDVDICDTLLRFRLRCRRFRYFCRFIADAFFLALPLVATLHATC